MKDPWAARNEYIDVALDRSNESVDRFFRKHAARELDGKERVAALKLLELQRHAMLMYTSCGWFFDEISGIETVQVLHYAGRAIDLAEQVFGDGVEADFLQRLAKAKSNLPEHGDGARIYEAFVKPSRVDLLKVGSHYAVSDIFEAYGDHAELYCYAVDRKEHSCRQSGNAKLVVGKARFTSAITQESATLDFGAVHFGEHHLAAGVRADGMAEGDRARLNELVEAYSHAEGKKDETEIRSCLRQVFGEVHSLQALFRDEQRKVLGVLSNSVLAEVDAAHRQVYERHAEFMRFLTSSGMPLPRSFQSSARSALNSFLRDALAADELGRDHVHSLLAEAKALDIILDAATLEFVTRKRIEKMAEAVATNVADVRSIEQLQKLVVLSRSLPFAVDLWWVQTLCHEWMGQAYREFLAKADAGDENAQAWIAEVSALSEQLLFLHPGGETVQVLPDSVLSRGMQNGA